MPLVLGVAATGPEQARSRHKSSGTAINRTVPRGLDDDRLWLSERGVAVDDLAQWLEELGLARYTRRFVENDIDLDVLPHLTDDELKQLGVTLGHRAKLRAALGCRPEAHPSARPGSPRARETGDAERRQVSVMFCDLVASTALSTELDAEDYRDLIQAYQNACASVVAGFEGGDSITEIGLELRSRAESKFAHGRMQTVGTDNVIVPAQTCMLQLDPH